VIVTLRVGGRALAVVAPILQVKNQGLKETGRAVAAAGRLPAYPSTRAIPAIFCVLTATRKVKVDSVVLLFNFVIII